MAKVIYVEEKINCYDNYITHLNTKSIVIDENTVQVIWKNQDMYDKVLSNL